MRHAGFNLVQALADGTSAATAILIAVLVIAGIAIIVVAIARAVGKLAGTKVRSSWRAIVLMLVVGLLLAGAGWNLASGLTSVAVDGLSSLDGP